MRPIKLTIKGLNSFNEVQVIDFEKLMEQGVFGIFGPTGSGKSTILDGITLALYGTVARKSTNFMNTNSDVLYVSYEFQISGKEVKRYRVEREYKRDTKTDSVRTKSAKIICIEEDRETVLEDKANLVTKKCEEILGLKHEDFTRTVVLPQGNFSEFLKLDGKERRDMLERLFNLELYGDELALRLGTKSKKEKEAGSILEGELKGYEDCSETILEEGKCKQRELEEAYGIEEQLYIKAESRFHESKQLWELQKELHSYLDSQQKLKEKEDEILQIKHRLFLAEKASHVTPYLHSFQITYNSITNGQKQLEEVEENYEKIKAKKQENLVLYEQAKEKKDQELPKLIVQEQQLKDALEEQKELNTIMEREKLLINQIKEIEATTKALNETKAELDKRISSYNNSVLAYEKDMIALRTDEEYKEKLRIGLNVQEKLEALENEKQELNSRFLACKQVLEQSEIKNNEFQNKKIQLDDKLIVAEQQLRVLQENVSVSPSELIELANTIAQLEAAEKEYRGYSDSIEKSKACITEWEGILAKKSDQKQQLEAEINQVNEQVKRSNTKRIIQLIRAELLEGEECPVCGGTYHTKTDVLDCKSEEILRLEDKLHEHQQMLEKVNLEIANLTASINQENRVIQLNEEKRSELGEIGITNRSHVLREEYVAKDKALKTYEVAKKSLDETAKTLNNEKTIVDNECVRYETTIVEAKKQKIAIESDLERNQELLTNAMDSYCSIKEELGVESLAETYREIQEKEKRRKSIEEAIEKIKVSLTKTTEEIKKFEEEIKIVEEDFIRKQTSLQGMKETIQIRQQSIRSKVGDDGNPEIKLEKLIKLKMELENNFTRTEQLKTEMERKFNEVLGQLTEMKGSISSLKERLVKEEEALNKVLAEEEFETIREAEAAILDKNSTEEFKSEIDDYDKRLLQLETNIKSLQVKVGERSLTIQEWTGIQEEKNRLEGSLKLLRDDLIAGRENLKKLQERLQAKSLILQKKSQIDKKIGLIEDLEKLFKGKKFVEYVATHQLKYIALEAGKKLKEVTNGTYGLEVDENGKFLIRDYKNGGAVRDASTLSGGEIFLASLCLALALSSQIQLKGTAPLELFFLDEGFGTLDENLLEVVMDSLEKIHHDKLSIGIISHLEVIKNRIPVKLLITPAEAGRGGSKVKIERN